MGGNCRCGEPDSGGCRWCARSGSVDAARRRGPLFPSASAGYRRCFATPSTPAEGCAGGGRAGERFGDSDGPAPQVFPKGHVDRAFGTAGRLEEALLHTDHSE